MPFRIALLVGKGSRVPCVLQCAKKTKNVRVVFVLSCFGEGIGTKAARRYKIKTAVLKWGDYKGLPNGREAFSSYALAALKKCKADLVVMAGWIVVMPRGFVEEFSGRVVNIHPSILPSFPGDGDRAIQAQWEARWDKDAPPAGCTLHYVDEGVDTGKPILRGIVYPRDYHSLEKFAEAIHQKEDEVLCEGIKLILAQRNSQD